TPEVEGLDDERVALPAPARVPGPPREGAVRAAVGRDDACVVDHLGEDDDVAGRLDDLQVVVVGAGNHRRTGVETEKTAIGDAELRVIVDAPRVALGPALSHPGARLDSERDAAIG